MKFTRLFEEIFPPSVATGRPRNSVFHALERVDRDSFAADEFDGNIGFVNIA